MSQFDLSRTLSWTRALQALAADDAATLAMLSDLQGNILKGHGRDHTANVFLTFKSGAAAAERARAFLREMGEQLPSALDQLTGAQIFKASGEDAGTFVAAFLSAAGYNALGLQDLLPTGDAFRAGMKQRQGVLQDPAATAWDAHLADSVHAMVLFANDDKVALARDLARLQQRIADSGGAITVLGIEEGVAHRNSDGQGIEHFGYVDGRSQPLMLDEDLKKEAGTGGIDQWNPAVPLSQVLVTCPGGGLDVSFGSYFVFRKLEQNVRGFKKREIALAAVMEQQSGNNPGELAGAYVVGRFENGTPTLLHDDEQPVGSEPNPVPNNFNYDGDPDGLRCPFAGHIRKTNPRDATIQSNGRLMARRGITYGARQDDPNDGKLDNKPEGGVGLLFMAYQSSLEDQFEFTQQSWANNVGFHFRAPVQPVGIDPVIGQPPVGGSQRYPLAYGAGPMSQPFDFSGFVTMKGGEYFFAPCRSFFKRLP